MLQKKKYVQHFSRTNSNCEKQVILLIMIPNEEKEGWYYIAVKKVQKIYIIKSNGIKNRGDFYCLSCLHSFKTGSTLKSHEK